MIQYVSQSAAQYRVIEWLLDQHRISIDAAASLERVADVAGHVDNLQVWLASTRLGCDVRSVQAPG